MVVGDRQDILWIKDIGKIRSVTIFIPENLGHKQQHKMDEWTWPTLQVKPMAPIE
ncbi:MAG: hypothetical protein M3M88_04200 [Thermoproteota archaeon]|nr:hypothetical protein [Thermoproteota archaeon]